MPARSNNGTAWPRASSAAAILSPTKPVPPKIRILISQSQHISEGSSQQPRTKILLGIHIRHQTSGWFRRLAARACQEAAGACFDRTLAVRDDDAPTR